MASSLLLDCFEFVCLQFKHDNSVNVCVYVATLSTAAMPIYPTRSDMTFATSCLRASGIIRKQLVQLDSVMHPAQSSWSPRDDAQRPGAVATAPRSLYKLSLFKCICVFNCDVDRPLALCYVNV